MSDTSLSTASSSVQQPELNNEYEDDVAFLRDSGYLRLLVHRNNISVWERVYCSLEDFQSVKASICAFSNPTDSMPLLYIPLYGSLLELGPGEGSVLDDDESLEVEEDHEFQFTFRLVVAPGSDQELCHTFRTENRMDFMSWVSSIKLAFIPTQEQKNITKPSLGFRGILAQRSQPDSLELERLNEEKWISDRLSAVSKKEPSSMFLEKMQPGPTDSSHLPVSQMVVHENSHRENVVVSNDISLVTARLSGYLFVKTVGDGYWREKFCCYFKNRFFVGICFETKAVELVLTPLPDGVQVVREPHAVPYISVECERDVALMLRPFNIHEIDAWALSIQEQVKRGVSNKEPVRVLSLAIAARDAATFVMHPLRGMPRMDSWFTKLVSDRATAQSYFLPKVPGEIIAGKQVSLLVKCSLYNILNERLEISRDLDAALQTPPIPVQDGDAAPNFLMSGRKLQNADVSLYVPGVELDSEDTRASERSKEESASPEFRVELGNESTVFVVRIRPTTAGHCRLHVSFRGHHVFGSPFPVHVVPAKVSPPMCHVVGTGANVASPVQENDFQIVARDASGNAVGHGNDDVDVELVGGDVVEIRDEGNGVYHVRYKLDNQSQNPDGSAVPYDRPVLSIKVNGAHIRDSPMSINVRNEPPVTAHKFDREISSTVNDRAYQSNSREFSMTNLAARNGSGGVNGSELGITASVNAAGSRESSRRMLLEAKAKRERLFQADREALENSNSLKERIVHGTYGSKDREIDRDKLRMLMGSAGVRTAPILPTLAQGELGARPSTWASLPPPPPWCSADELVDWIRQQRQVLHQAVLPLVRTLQEEQRNSGEIAVGTTSLWKKALLAWPGPNASESYLEQLGNALLQSDLDNKGVVFSLVDAIVRGEADLLGRIAQEEYQRPVIGRDGYIPRAIEAEYNAASRTQSRPSPHSPSQIPSSPEGSTGFEQQQSHREYIRQLSPGSSTSRGQRHKARLRKSDTNNFKCDPRRMEIGTKIALRNGMVGVVRYVGRVKDQAGIWLGIELSIAIGNCDGDYDGVAYFKCRLHQENADLHFGMFVRPEFVLSEIRSSPKSSKNRREEYSLPKKVKERFQDGRERQGLRSSTRERKHGVRPRHANEEDDPSKWSRASVVSHSRNSHLSAYASSVRTNATPRQYEPPERHVGKQAISKQSISEKRRKGLKVHTKLSVDGTHRTSPVEKAKRKANVSENKKSKTSVETWLCEHGLQHLTKRMKEFDVVQLSQVAKLSDTQLLEMGIPKSQHNRILKCCADLRLSFVHDYRMRQLHKPTRPPPPSPMQQQGQTPPRRAPPPCP